MPISQKRGHRLGERVSSPAYIDANFLVYYAVGSGQAPDFQVVARNVMGDLLAQNVVIIVSLVSIEEAWWATLHELYCRHIWKAHAAGAQCRFTRDTAKSNWSRLMHYTSDLEKIVGGLEELRLNGADIRFIPECEDSFSTCDNVPHLMKQHGLFSADALHLSLALSQARTLITFDVEDFQKVVGFAGDLTIMLLPS